MTTFKDVKFSIGGSSVGSLEEVLSGLDKVVQDVMQNMQQTLEQIATRMVAEMKARAPVESGGLRASIRWTPAKKRPGVVIMAGGTEITMKATAAGFQFDEVLGVEYGTTKMGAQPFFYPIVEAYRTEAANAVQLAMQRTAQGTI